MCGVIWKTLFARMPAVEAMRKSAFEFGYPRLVQVAGCFVRSDPFGESAGRQENFTGKVKKVEWMGWVRFSSAHWVSHLVRSASRLGTESV